MSASLRDTVFCAFCRHERTIYERKHVGVLHAAAAVALSVLLSLGLWGHFDGRGFLIFTLLLFVSEVFVYFRWRTSLPCPHCSFDPVLYKKDRARCAREVKAHLDILKQSGRVLLKRKNPFAHLKSRAPTPPTSEQRRVSAFDRQV
jgi:hypothetical protein